MAEKDFKFVTHIIALCFRTLMQIILSLFTIRLLLSNLGVQYYGVYGAIWALISGVGGLFFGAFASACQRFFSVELGKENASGLTLTFGVTLYIFATAAVVLFLFAETFGTWFLHTQLNLSVPDANAVNIFYQVSLITYLIYFATIPYNSIIIAHEKFYTFTSINLLEIFLKFIISCSLFLFSGNKLVYFAVLTFFSTVLVSAIQVVYCQRKLGVKIFGMVWERKKFSEIISFSGWNFFGSVTSVSFEQGVNILTNIFFGPFMNATKGISNQVGNVINQVSLNFNTVMRPFMIKSYAKNNTGHLIKALVTTTKFSFFLSLFIALPILLETEFIVNAWLDKIPPYTIEFIRLTIIFSLVNMLHIPITIVVQASGVIKRYQIIIGVIMMQCIPLSYILLKIDANPVLPFYVMIGLSLLALIFRVFFLIKLVPIRFSTYFFQVIFKIFLIFFVTYIAVYMWADNISYGAGRFIGSCLISWIVLPGLIFLLGITRSERKDTLRMIRGSFKIKASS